MCKKEKNAYFTVEASILMPFIFGGIIFVIYLGIYLYNVCTLKQVSYIAALRGSQLKTASNEEINSYTEQQLNHLLDHQILAKEELETKIHVTNSKVKVEITTKITMPFAEFMSKAIDFWKIENEAEANRLNPVDIIRNVRKINESKISE